MTIIISEVLRPAEQTSTSLQKLIREQASLWADMILGWNEPTLMTIINHSITRRTILRRLGEMGEKISSLHFIFCKTAWMKVVPIFFLSQLLLPLRGPITVACLITAPYDYLAHLPGQSYWGPDFYLLLSRIIIKPHILRKLTPWMNFCLIFYYTNGHPGWLLGTRLLLILCQDDY